MTKESDNATAIKVICAAAAEYGVTAEAIMSPTRKARVSEARQMAMYILNRYCGFTAARIGESFGKNHSTVSRSVVNVAGFLKMYRAVREHEEAIRERLQL